MRCIWFCLIITLSFLDNSFAGTDTTASGVQENFNSSAQSTRDNRSSADSFVAFMNNITSFGESLASLNCADKFAAEFFLGTTKTTCAPIPLLPSFLTTLAAPNSIGAFYRLAMDAPDVLKDQSGKPYYNCDYANRADYYNPTVKFAFCSNRRIITQGSSYFLNYFKTVFTESLKAFTSEPGTYVVPDTVFKPKPENIYDVITLNIPPGQQRSAIVTQYDVPSFGMGTFLSGGITSVTDLGSVYMPLTLVKKQDMVCVSIDNTYIKNEIGCKYMKDPYQYSKYAGFMGEDASIYSGQRTNSTDYANSLSQASADLGCNNISSCYYTAINQSRTLLPISAPITNCVKAMLSNLVGSPSVCSTTAQSTATDTSITGAITKTTSAFFVFQKNMKGLVQVLLIIYIMHHGALIATGQMQGSQAIMGFVLRIVLVTYFSIGLSSSRGTFNGMVDWVFPILLNGMNEIAGWIVSNTTNGLCSFAASDYGSGPSMALWDSLDCRVAHYIGINGITDLFTSVRDSGRYSGEVFSAVASLARTNYSIPPYMLLIAPALYTGNIYLFSVALTFPIMVIAMVSNVLQLTLTAMIYIVILGIMAPIFVPMALFSSTYSYFENWAKSLFGLIFQPAIAVTFIVIMFGVYDWGYSRDCQYQPVSVKMPGGEILKTFYIRLYDQSKECKKSLAWYLAQKVNLNGYSQPISISDLAVLNLQSESGLASFLKELDPGFVRPSPGFKYVAAQTGKMLETVADGFGYEPGNFISIPTAALKNFWGLCASMLTCCFTLYIGSYLTDILPGFVANLSGGLRISGIASARQTSAALQGYMGGKLKALNDFRKKKDEKKDGGGEGDGSQGASDSLKGKGDAQASDSFKQTAGTSSAASGAASGPGKTS